MTNEKPELTFNDARNTIDDIWLQIKSLDLAEKKELYDLLGNYLHKNKPSLDTSYISQINPTLTFDNFIIDPSNRFAVAAAEAVANANGKAYNPLFIYGGTSSGKTHLLHAIGNYLLENKEDAKIIYVNSDQFMKDYIDSIAENKHKEFRSRFQHSDVLLLDDVDLLAGKEQTQEELFHVFNILHEKSKQIVITSTQSPEEIPAMLERLKSRFQWGLVTHISKANTQPINKTTANVGQNELDLLKSIEQLELEVKELSAN